MIFINNQPLNIINTNYLIFVNYIININNINKSIIKIIKGILIKFANKKTI